MPVYELEESNYNGPIADGTWLNAEVHDIDEIEETDRQTGDKKKKVAIYFVVSDPDSEYDGQKIRGKAPKWFSNHPDCKLYNWTQAILGVDELPPGFRLNTDELKDLDCKILVGAYEFTRDDGETRSGNYVKDVARSGQTETGAGSAF